MNTQSDALVAHFMHLIQIGFCLFGAFIILIINNHIKNVKTDNRKDYGLDFIAGVLIVWAVQSIIAELPQEVSSEPKSNSPDILGTLLSTFNNGLLLASLTFFIYGFDKLRNKFETFDNPDKWIRFVLLWSIILSTSLICLQYIGRTNTWLVNLATYFDLIYSIVILGSIGYAITASFKGRGYSTLFVSFGIFFALLNLTSQILPFINGQPRRNASERLQWENSLIVCSQIFFIILLLILAQTWAVEVEQKRVNKNEDEDDTTRKTSNKGAPILTNIQQQEFLKIAFLKIGIVEQGNGRYFFELAHPKFEKSYSTRMSRPTNVFKFLLSLANAKKTGVPHTIKIKAAGKTTYSSADFNNILIRDLNDKLTRERFERILKEELLLEVDGNWEISLAPENIELVKLEEMKVDEQLSEIFQP